jgi:preprotein translocase subunit SecG
MSTFSIFLILIVIVAFLLVVVVMVQNPKGGGLASTFGGGGTQQLGGVKKTTDFLDKSTWTLAILLIGLILLSNVAIGPGDGAAESKALDQNEVNTTTQQVPTTNNNADTATPANATSADSTSN